MLGPIAAGLSRRLSEGGRAAARPGAPEEVARLREEVDRLGGEVARLREEQAFMLKLLAPGEKPQGSGPAG